MEIVLDYFGFRRMNFSAASLRREEKNLVRLPLPSNDSRLLIVKDDSSI